MYEHPCIKCGTKYKDVDVDPYLCETCNEARKEIAKAVDLKMASMPRVQTKSALQVYDELRKAKGTPFVGLEELNRHL